MLLAAAASPGSLPSPAFEAQPLDWAGEGFWDHSIEFIQLPQCPQDPDEVIQPDRLAMLDSLDGGLRDPGFVGKVGLTPVPLEPGMGQPAA
jgi:hypothetical protein